MHKILHTSHNRKIAYQYYKGKSQIGFIFFSGFCSDMTGTKAKDWEKIAFTYGKGIEQAQSALIGIQSKVANQLNTLKNIAKADSAAKDANEKLLLERKFIEETEALQKYLAASKMIQAPIGRALRMQREKIMDTDSIITGFKLLCLIIEV